LKSGSKKLTASFNRHERRRKLTIKHGELKNLDMPAMTMVFQVKDKVRLDQGNPATKSASWPTRLTANMR
jgi:Cu/Ag efflux protein CusF